MIRSDPDGPLGWGRLHAPAWDARLDTIVSLARATHGAARSSQAPGRDTRNCIPMSFRFRNEAFAGASDAGGGTRTPDTRIMIPLLFGSTAGCAGAGGPKRGHVCLRLMVGWPTAAVRRRSLWSFLPPGAPSPLEGAGALPGRHGAQGHAVGGRVARDMRALSFAALIVDVSTKVIGSGRGLAAHGLLAG